MRMCIRAFIGLKFLQCVPNLLLGFLVHRFFLFSFYCVQVYVCVRLCVHGLVYLRFLVGGKSQKSLHFINQ